MCLWDCLLSALLYIYVDVNLFVMRLWSIIMVYSYLCYCLLSMCFRVLMLGFCWMVGYRLVFPRFQLIFIRIGSFSVSCESIFVSVFDHSIFDIVFVLKCKKRNGNRAIPTDRTVFQPYAWSLWIIACGLGWQILKGMQKNLMTSPENSLNPMFFFSEKNRKSFLSKS